MYIFPFEMVPFLGDVLVFQSVPLFFSKDLKVGETAPSPAIFQGVLLKLRSCWVFTGCFFFFGGGGGN